VGGGQLIKEPDFNLEFRQSGKKKGKGGKKIREKKWTETVTPLSKHLSNRRVLFRNLRREEKKRGKSIQGNEGVLSNPG